MMSSREVYEVLRRGISGQTIRDVGVKMYRVKNNCGRIEKCKRENLGTGGR